MLRDPNKKKFSHRFWNLCLIRLDICRIVIYTRRYANFSLIKLEYIRTIVNVSGHYAF